MWRRLGRAPQTNGKDGALPRRRYVLPGCISPDPITAFCIPKPFAAHAAVVFFIPANGVEQELPIFGPAIFERLSSDDIMRKLLYKGRGEQFELARELAMGKVVP